MVVAKAGARALPFANLSVRAGQMAPPAALVRNKETSEGYACLNRSNYTTYAIARQAGGLEGLQPSKKLFSRCGSGDAQRAPGRRSRSEEGISGRPGTLWVPPRTPPPRNSCN
jgi:hypothetical protein